MTAGASARLQAHLENWVANGDVSVAFGLVGKGESVLWQGGVSSSDPQPRSRTLFDLGSLTKPHVATLALLLDQSGILELGAAVGSIWPECSGQMAGITLEELLRHRSRLVPWFPFYEACRSPREVEAKLLSGELLGGRLGVYSDLGYILWGLAAETRLGEPLADILESSLLRPMGSATTRSVPGEEADVAFCECGNGMEVELARRLGFTIEPRGGPETGRVQDGNAAFLGGLAGHAGLFSSAADVFRFANHWLAALRGDETMLRPDIVSAALGGVGAHVLGWTRRRTRGPAGRALSRSSFGHTGFPGTSLWIEPETETVMVLLAQRRSPLSDLDLGRRRFHRLGAELVADRSGGEVR